jgi:hypothetical protein
MESKGKYYLKEKYNLMFGDFSIKTLTNLIVVMLATVFIPFFGTGFSFLIFYDFGFWISAFFKIFTNMIIRKTLANHTYDDALKSDEDIKNLHTEMQDCKNKINTKNKRKLLKEEIDKENMLNRLRTAFDILEVKLSKANNENSFNNVSERQDNIRDYMDSILTGSEDKDLYKKIVKDIVGIKNDNWTLSNIFSKSHTVTTSKKREHNRRKEINKRVNKSGAFAVISIVLTNAVDFISKGFNGNSFIQMLINITLLVYSGTTGVQIGNEVIEDYKDVLSDKVSFLKSFCNEYVIDNDMIIEPAKTEDTK